ncbi:MAG TPA: MFS transporter [Caulobacteraceae bacterium]|jgi:MFS family permease|nr:MFS transporter [Caulobacteraceae bacterium]
MTFADPTDPIQAIRTRPMAPVQVAAVALCIAINMVDGFDVMIASFTGPGIAKAWGLKPTDLGLLFSAAPFGMMIGAVALSPLSDLFGRRRTIPLFLLLVTAGMLVSAFAPGLGVLVASRVATGVGICATMAAINTVTAEQSNDRRRDLAVSLQATGFPAGGALGALAFLLAPGLDWRAAFLCGAILSVVLLVLALVLLPESFGFLIARKPKGALEALNRQLARMGLATLTRLPDPMAPQPGQSAQHPWTGLAWPASLICVSYFALMFTFYFLTSWTPKLLADFGLAARAAVSGAMLINLGGVLGDLVFSALAAKWPARRIGPLFMAGAFIMAVAFALAPRDLNILLPLAFLIGFLLYGAMASLYAAVPGVFPAAVRTSGTGLALGIGRVGATAGPYIGGLLVAAAWTRPGYVTIMSAPLIVCAIALALLSSWLATRTARDL